MITKRLLALYILSCGLFMGMQAQVRGNNIVVTVEPDHQDWNYKVGVTSIGNLSQQWAAGARWSWFMPWYDGDGATAFHAEQTWWQDAMNQDYVITRDQLPSFAE